MFFCEPRKYKGTFVPLCFRCLLRASGLDCTKTSILEGLNPWKENACEKLWGNLFFLYIHWLYGTFQTLFIMTPRPRARALAKFEHFNVRRRPIARWKAYLNSYALSTKRAIWLGEPDDWFLLSEPHIYLLSTSYPLLLLSKPTTLNLPIPSAS